MCMWFFLGFFFFFTLKGKMDNYESSSLDKNWFYLPTKFILHYKVIALSLLRNEEIFFQNLYFLINFC